MIFDENSSYSEESENFGGLAKKVPDNDIKLEDSEGNSSELISQNKEKRKNYSKRISSLMKRDESEIGKTKTVKKNCVSAKMSRQRKKLYIQLLQKKAADLREEILNRKKSISKNRDSIMEILKETNSEKFNYIQENLKDSRALVAQINKPKSSDEKEQAIDREKLNLMINSYLYKFGFNGVLRKDVIELLKRRWYELAINEKILLNGRQQELKRILEKFQNCLSSMNKKGQRLQYLFRQLRSKMPPEQFVKLLVKKEFLVSDEPVLTKKKQIDIGDLEDSS